jgi:uncharacterized protein YukJ
LRRLGITLPYGFAKATVTGDPWLKASRGPRETQYHVHAGLDVAGEPWDVAINVGADDADDLLVYKLVYDFHHAVLADLLKAPMGRNDLAGTNRLPALDFQRSDVLAETGLWRVSGVMDGSLSPEPVASIVRLLSKAKTQVLTIYVFGRFYSEGEGIHDTHMNQGSTGRYLHRPGSGDKDQNDIWQDGALLVDLGAGRWAGYFAAFQTQLLPTDDLGNPRPEAKPIGAQV